MRLPLGKICQPIEGHGVIAERTLNLDGWQGEVGLGAHDQESGVLEADEAAIHREELTGDEAISRANQEGRCCGNVLGIGEAA